VSLLLPEKWLREYSPLIEARADEIARTCGKEIAGTAHRFRLSGVLAVGKVPPAPNLEAILQATPRPRLLAAVDGMSNAETSAPGPQLRRVRVQALLVNRTSSSPFLRRAVRSSMGVIFRLPVIEGPTWLRRSASCARMISAASPLIRIRTNACCRSRFSSDCCIVFGSEGYGLSSEVLDLCDATVAVPMSAEVDSLNVGSAAAVFFYETARQRGRRRDAYKERKRRLFRSLRR